MFLIIAIVRAARNGLTGLIERTKRAHIKAERGRENTVAREGERNKAHSRPRF